MEQPDPDDHGLTISRGGVIVANVLVDGSWVNVEPRLATAEDVRELAAKLDKVVAFLEELRPFLEMAKTYTTGSKLEKVRMAVRHGR